MTTDIALLLAIAKYLLAERRVGEMRVWFATEREADALSRAVLEAETQPTAEEDRP